MVESLLGNQITIMVFGVLLLLAAVSDVISYKIPNKVVVAILALYPVHVLTSPAGVEWLPGLATFAVALIAGFGLFATGKFGAGDAKLLAAIMLWAGPGLAPLVVIVSAVSGGVLAVILLSPLRTTLAGALYFAGWQAASEALLSKQMPYGVPIALGGFVVCWALLGSSGLSG